MNRILRERRNMETSVRVLTLGRNRLRSVSSSVESGLGRDEFTHISLHGSYPPPQLRVKIKYPQEVDDASPLGMLSECDSDEIFDKIHQFYPNWEVFLDVKRITHYSKHAPPRSPTQTQPARPRITVKVRYSSWSVNVNAAGVRQAVEEVMNKTGEFSIDVRTEKCRDN